MTGISLIPLMVPIILVVKNRIFINKFRKTNTTSSANAKTLEELKVSRRLLFFKLSNAGALIEIGGKYYLDEQKLSEYKRRKRMILIPVIIILMLLIFFVDIYY